MTQSSVPLLKVGEIAGWKGGYPRPSFACNGDILDKLAFRDYLRANETVALAYADLKRRLAVDHRFDNIGHMRGKDAFVKSVLLDARLDA